MRRAWVIYQLRIRGKSFRSLAAELGTTHQAISLTMLAPNAHLEPGIARAIGLTAQELFPERFDATGRRLHRTREQRRTTRVRTAEVGVA